MADALDSVHRRLAAHLRRRLRGRTNLRLARNAPVALAGVLTYLVEEVLTGADATRRQSARAHKRLTPRDVRVAIRVDDELDQLCTSAVFPISEASAPSLPPAGDVRRRRAKRMRAPSIAPPPPPPPPPPKPPATKPKPPVPKAPKPKPPVPAPPKPKPGVTAAGGPSAGSSGGAAGGSAKPHEVVANLSKGIARGAGTGHFKWILRKEAGGLWNEHCTMLHVDNPLKLAPERIAELRDAVVAEAARRGLPTHDFVYLSPAQLYTLYEVYDELWFQGNLSAFLLDCGSTLAFTEYPEGFDTEGGGDTWGLCQYEGEHSVLGAPDHLHASSLSISIQWGHWGDMLGAKARTRKTLVSFNGVHVAPVTDTLRAVCLVLEHELVHAVTFAGCVGAKQLTPMANHGRIFQSVAKNWFGHTSYTLEGGLKTIDFTVSSDEESSDEESSDDDVAPASSSGKGKGKAPAAKRPRTS